MKKQQTQDNYVSLVKMLIERYGEQTHEQINQQHYE